MSEAVVSSPEVSPVQRVYDAWWSVEMAAHANLANHHNNEKIILDSLPQEPNPWQVEITRTPVTDESPTQYPVVHIAQQGHDRSYYWLAEDSVLYIDADGNRDDSELRAEEMADLLEWAHSTMRADPTAYRVELPVDHPEVEMQAALSPADRVWKSVTDIIVEVYGAEYDEQNHRDYHPGFTLGMRCTDSAGTAYRKEFSLAPITTVQGTRYVPRFMKGYEDTPIEGYQLMDDSQVLSWYFGESQAVPGTEDDIITMNKELQLLLQEMRARPQDVEVLGDDRG